MIEVSTLAPKVHNVKISGELRSADMQQMTELAETIASGSDKANIVFDIENVEGFEWSAVSEEMAHLPALMKMLGRLDRIAVISDHSWIRTAARIESALLPGVTYEVFPGEKAEQARSWVLGETNDPHAGSLRLIDVGDTSIVAFECDGRVDRNNAETTIFAAKEIMENTGARLMLARIKNWHGFDPALLASGSIAKSKAEFIKRLDRYAIVGGPAWMRSLAEAMGPVVNVDIKSFELDEERHAIEWLKE